MTIRSFRELQLSISERKMDVKRRREEKEEEEGRIDNVYSW